MLERVDRLTLKQVPEDGGIATRARAWAPCCAEKSGVPEGKVLSVVLRMVLTLWPDKAGYRKVLADLLAIGG